MKLDLVPAPSSQLKPMLHTVDAFAQVVDGVLLRSNRTVQVTNVLQHRSLTLLQSGQARLDLPQVALDAILPGLKALEMPQNEVVDAFRYGLAPLWKNT